MKGLSDRLIGIGPFGIGLDGVLAWVPGLGTAYSLAAGGALIFSGITGGASLGTLLRMGAYLAADSMSSTVPVAGWAIDTLFPAHLMAAKALQKDIEKRHGPAEMPLGWGGKKKRARGGKLRNVTPQL
ncbi:MAG: DUF4112 domain-containing protein [Phenylobacterium sp.]|nr:DUF4112 domain-containing protein [Phenylobacterium sp.]MDO9247978.1 DUF4112 domain-containing protein [Phenylobacterium sp.]MDP2009911.1 DUF4112 domain-containing protein [Phenylobacterium sp.]MDP3099965.1 DUF4112 domain-containing protein [Phenylobacterium sp.]MDP3870596.1 DUF4112 domain-containing protein [Phenylobacterium sp.]HQT55462.1 DUF4112 domain-containing protein [Phenylobacterium sp.]